MTFSKEWNLAYKKNLQINNWPFSELILGKKATKKIEKFTILCEEDFA